MKFELVEHLADVMARSSLCEIEYIVQGDRVHMTRLPRRDLPVREQPAIAASDPKVASIAPPRTIVAGIGGVFYRASVPGGTPFIQEGDAVCEGQKIGVVEAMKTLIAIESDQQGIVSRILVDDGTAVTAGTAIVEINVEVPNSV